MPARPDKMDLSMGKAMKQMKALEKPVPVSKTPKQIPPIKMGK